MLREYSEMRVDIVVGTEMGDKERLRTPAFDKISSPPVL
jgi:hypothetical protein